MGWLEHVVLALLAWPAQFLTRPGVLTSDTKSYLYIDPGTYLRQSASMWDPTVGLGTVTHQQIGYLFPMGPFFWATHALAVPTWAAQRLWVGAILFAAGAGVLLLCRTLGVGRPGRLVAALAYMLSPYVLQYLGHISVILLAFAALPWLLAMVERSMARGGWRWPALVALVAAAMGSVNASSAVYVAVGPLVWVVYVLATRLHPGRAVAAAVGRIVLLGVLASLWWAVGLAVEGGYGLDVLRYTETVQAVSTTSLSSEVLRGLGYWYFYGGDNFGPWISATPQFTQEVWLLGLGYAVPLLGVAGAFVVRWRHRVAFVAMAAIGMVLAVGAYPYADPSPAGTVLRAFFTNSTLGMALRSTDRATPLVLLGLSMLAGAAVTALWRWSPVAGWVLAGVAAAAAVAANPALWNGATIPASFVEAPVAAYEHQAAAALDRGGTSAVLAMPGQPFAATFAGMSVDPVWPGLITRPFVTREQQVMGSLATEDLLYGLDDPIQSGVADPAAFAPLARLMGVGDLLVQNDLAFTRYDQPDPALLWHALTARPVPGLGTPTGYGPVRPALTRGSVIDQQTYTLPATTAPMPAVATVRVNGTRSLVRSEPSAGALVVDGEGTGLDDVASTGLLSGNPTLLYAGTLDTHSAARAAALRPGATLVVTDTNRKQAFRWDNLQDVAGPTLGAGQRQPATPQNNPLDIFPGAPADAFTTTRLQGLASVTASASGNPFQYLPEDRPSGAIDGDPDTAWQVGPFLDPVGQWWQATFDRARTVDRVTLLQPQVGDHNQWITSVTLRFDGGAPLRVALGPSSRHGAGQVVAFPARSVRTLRVTIDATNLPPMASLQGGISAVGLAEVGVADVRAEEQVVMPSDLLRAAGAASSSDRLAVVMTRLRVAPATSRTDPEAWLDRRFWLPAVRTFTVTGTARLSTLAPDPVIDAAVGRPPGVTATSNERLAGDAAATASAALDGDPATAWTSRLGDHHQVGATLSVDLPAPVTFDHLDLQVVVDGRHSVPSRLRVSTEHASAVVDVPKLARRPHAGGTDTVTVHFPALSGAHVSVTVLAVRPLRWVDYFTGSKTALPMAIAELGIPGVHVAPAPSQMPDTCRSDLLQVDGTPVWIRLTGSTAAALAGGGVGLSLCGPDAGGLALGPGDHHVVAAPGLGTGIDLDQLVFDSAPGGGPMAADRPGAVVAAPSSSGPRLGVERRSATAMTVQLHVGGAGTGGPFWLVLGESLNKGWTASLVDGPSLGAPVLVDGFANGWLVTPAELAAASRPGGDGTVTVELRWRPQQAVDAALVVSAATGGLCLVLALWPRRRRRGRDRSAAGLGAADAPAVAWPWAAAAPGRAPTQDRRRTRALRVAAASVGAGVVAGVCVAPLAGVAVAGAAAFAASVRRGRLVLAAGATGLVLATAVTMMVIEAADHLYGNGDWGTHFGVANTFTWLAVSLLVADVFVTGTSGDGRAGAVVSPAGAPEPADRPGGADGDGAHAEAPATSAPPSSPS